MSTTTISTNFSADNMHQDSSKIIEPDVTQIVHIVFHVIIFCIGLNIQIKTINACKEEKGKTWKIHISHAIVTTVYYGFFIPFQAVTTFVPSLSIYTGCWICYLASFVSFYCQHALVGNSLHVAIMKYIFIVHSFKAKSYGEEKIQNIFFWLNSTMPLVIAIIGLLTNDFQMRSALNSCFGEAAHPSLMANHCPSGNLNILICTNLNRSDYVPILYYVLQCFCVSRKIINLIMVSNMPEAYFYYKIFSVMQRYAKYTTFFIN